MESGTSTRRRFLKVMGAGSLGAAALVLGVLQFPYRAAREWWLGLDTGVAPGELGNLHLRILLSVTETITHSQIGRTHYEEFFRWRALTLPGHKALYERLTSMLDAEAREHGRKSFLDCVEAERDQILEHLDKVRRNRMQRMVTLAADRDWLLLDEHVVQPVLELFARTDAWLLLGYPAWPGVARGFEFLEHPQLRHSRADTHGG
jgi:hypothetical protein